MIFAALNRAIEVLPQLVTGLGLSTSADAPCNQVHPAHLIATGKIAIRKGGGAHGARISIEGGAELVDVRDSKGELGRVNPYGIYDLQNTSNWVSVGCSADTSQFGVEPSYSTINSIGTTFPGR